MSLQLQAASSCQKVIFLGSLIEKEKQLYFITHLGSQKEKHWPISIKNGIKKIEWLAFQGKLIEIQGTLSTEKLYIETISPSVKFSESQKAMATRKIGNSPCPL